MATGTTTLFLRKLPFNDQLILMRGEDAGKATDELVKWAESIQRQSGASPVAPQPGEQITDITASTSGTFGGNLSAGLYAIYAYREVVVADPVSSSLALALAWTHNGKAMTRNLSAFSGAPQTINDSKSDVEVVEIDPNTTISYTLTYASNTPDLAEFQCSLIANLLQTFS